MREIKFHSTLSSLLFNATHLKYTHQFTFTSYEFENYYVQIASSLHVSRYPYF